MPQPYTPGPQRQPLLFLQATDDATDRTADIQNALNSARHVYFGPGLYVITSNIDIPSDTWVQLDPLAVWQRSTSMSAQTQMIRMIGVSNIIFEGGTVDGNRGTPGLGGQCAGITTSGATDVVIRDVIVKNWPADVTGGSYGYGIYMGAPLNERILISKVHVTVCEQNCMFLVSGRDITIENSTFSDAEGTTPGSGLDIEPNSQEEIVQNLIVRNCVFERNYYGITCNNHYAGYWHDILIEGCSFRNNRGGGAGFSGSLLPESNFRFKSCNFVNNAGDGLYVAGTLGTVVDDCRMEGNHGIGLRLFGTRDFRISKSHAHNNFSSGMDLRMDDDVPLIGAFSDLSLFNNGGYGLSVSKSSPASTCVAGLRFNFIDSGNQDYLKYPDWTTARDVVPDFRVLRGGNIYQCSVAGTTSGGPSGTGTGIVDGSARWDFVMVQPVQLYGFQIYGEGARGSSFNGCENYGNTTAHIYEWPSADANTYRSAAIQGISHVGQFGSHSTRSRSVPFEDKSASPGSYTSDYTAGLAAIAAGASSLVVSTIFAKPGDGVNVTIQNASEDTTLTRVRGRVSADGSITIAGNASATAAVTVFWELVKKGTLP